MQKVEAEMSKFYTRWKCRYVCNQWEREKNGKGFDFRGIDRYLNLMKKPEDVIIDQQTWEDLDLGKQFQIMDRTFSHSGRQMLYNMTRTLQFDQEELKRRGRLIRFFENHEEERKKIQCLMYYIGKRHSDHAAKGLFEGMAKPPAANVLVIPGTIGFLLSLISIPFLKYGSILLIMFFLIMNLCLHFVFQRNTERSMPVVRTVARMIEAADEIAKLNLLELDEYYNEFFRETGKKCRKILWKIRAYGAGSTADPWGLTALVQLLLLSEERTYIGCYKYIEEEKDLLRELYVRLGELDAFQAVAYTRSQMNPVCEPEFTDERCLEVVQISHPVLKDAVGNDLSLKGMSLVLTGSNMSGKSTFLRALACNAVLAQTFDLVKAESYRASMFHTATSISPSDNLETGQNYYMAEATALLRMLPVCDSGRCALLAIDEIFRGTNPAERVAGASSLLTYLSKRNCIVLVATHDIEIIRNVREQYQSFHFEEQVSRDSLKFDYILRPGILKKPNGIHILEYIGFPDEIILPALQDVQKMGECEEQQMCGKSSPV